MNFGLGYAFSAKDIFSVFDINSVKLEYFNGRKTKEKKYKRILAISIFLYSVKCIIDDIIDNGVIFLLPCDSGEIHFKKIEKDDFIKQWRNGRWRDVDYLATNFTAFHLIWSYKFPKSGITKEKNIYVSPEQKKRLIKNINNGKLYY